MCAVHVLVVVEAREGHQVSSSVSLHLVPLRRGLLVKPALAIFQLGRQPASPSNPPVFTPIPPCCHT